MRPRLTLGLALAGAFLLLCLGAWFLAQRESHVPGESESPVVTAPAAASAPAFSPTPTPPILPRDQREAGLPAIVAVTPLPLANPAERSPLADLLHAPERTGIQDLEVVLNLFEHYLRTFRGLPSGESNAQIVNALTGNNPRRVALIERSHPAINPKGELTDRWGTPLFFHLVASDALEIRSAGPDKILWSEDDVLTASPRLRASAPPP